MDSFPAVPWDYDGSAIKFLDGIVVDRAMDGTPYAQNLFSAVQKEISLAQGLMSLADDASIASFYAAHLNAVFTFVWAQTGASYNCIFGPNGYQSKPVAAGYQAVSVSLVIV